MPTASVILPTYNRAEVLPQAVESVLDQTVTDIEVVVVDDGSTDDTADVVEDFADDRVEYVAHETNRGANVARNTGIEAATGEYVAFLDSDDAWHPRKLERQLEALSGRSDEWVAAYCDFEKELSGSTGWLKRAGAGILADESTTRREGGQELRAGILDDTVETCAGSTLLVERSVADRVGGFDESLDRFQDPDFVLSILEEGKLAYVDEPLVSLAGAGSPAPETVEEADRAYLAKHAEHVGRLEEAGVDVTGIHRFLLAKQFAADGQFVRAGQLLSDARVVPRQYPGLVWSVGTGIRRRRWRVGAALVTLLGCYLLVARRRS